MFPTLITLRVTSGQPVLCTECFGGASILPDQQRRSPFHMKVKVSGFPHGLENLEKWKKLFPVREFCADWKSQGNLDKILEKSGKFREFLFFVLFLIELYLLQWIKFSVFRPTWWCVLSGCPIWGKLCVPQPVPVVLVQIVYWVYY